MVENKIIVFKPNSIIWMQVKLNLIQLKVFALLMAKAVENPDILMYKFFIKDLLEKCNIHKTNYTLLKENVSNMIKPVIFKKIDEKWEDELHYPLIEKIHFSKWVIEIAINREVKPLLLNIANRYTKYYFKNIAFLNSSYSIRIYELLKEYEYKKYRKIKVDELKFLLDIPKNSYKRSYDLKTKVILKAQKELKEKTDIFFDFNEIKTWKKLEEIEFIIKSKNAPQKQLQNSSKNSLFTLLKTKALLSDKQIETVLKQYETDYIKRNLHYTLQQKNIKNIAWYFLKALEQDFWWSILIKEELEKLKKQKELQEQKKKEELEKQRVKKEQERKLKIKKFINENLEEVKELIADFIEVNKFIFANINIDKESVFKIIKGELQDKNHIKILFYAYISKVKKID